MPSRSIHSVISRRTSSTETSVPFRAAMAWLRNCVTDTPSMRLGVLEGEEQARLGPNVGGPVRDVLAVEVDAPCRDGVGGMAQQGTCQRRLPRAVRAHQRVYLAGADDQVDPAQDGAVLGGHVQVSDLEQRTSCAVHRLKAYLFGQVFWTGRRPGSPHLVPAALTSLGRPIPAGGGTRSRRSWRRRGRAGRWCRASKVAKIRRSIDWMMVAKSPPSNDVLPGPPGNRVSPVNRRLRALDGEADRARGVARRGQRATRRSPTSSICVVVEEQVVAGQHAGVGAGDSDRVPGVSHRGHRLDVVPVPVRLDDRADAEALADLEQRLVLVGRVDQHGVARAAAAQDVDVVVHRADDDLVDLGARVAPDLLRLSHGPSVAQPGAFGRGAARVW